MRTSLFVLSAVLFTAHQLTQKVWEISIPWADSYLDPLLCMPILLTGFTIEQRWLTKRPSLQPIEILAATGFLSFLFEWGFPRWSTGFTQDPWDVAAYFCGAALFYLLGR